MTQYATERDLQRFTPEVTSRVNPLRRITAWVEHDTNVYKAYQVGAVQVCFVDGDDWGAAEATLVAVDAASEWFHDTTNDILYIYLTTDPNESRVEAGEDSATSFTWVLTRASRLLDSLLDANLKIPTLRDRAGNYDDVIIQATCYMAAWIALISEDRELADYYHAQVSNAEHTGIADYLNSGKVKLSRSVDIHSASGELIAETVVGDLHIVDIKGRWSGTDGDTLLIKATKAGVFGTGEFTSYGYDSANKTMQTLALVSDEVVTGQFQHIGGGLEIQFGGESGKAFTLNDQWEIKVRASHIPVDEGGFNTMEATRL